MWKKPIIIAHRGAAKYAPENTISAFELALQQGADAIELDIHLTKDNHLVVCHDEKIDKTTNGSGYIKDMTVAQLKKFDAGSWFSKEYQGERIPLLEEVIDIIPKHILINIEIKSGSVKYPKIEEKLINLLVKKNCINQTLVSSFDHKILKKISMLNRNIKIGLLYRDILVSPAKYALLFGCPVFSLHPKKTIVTYEDIVQATNNGIYTFPWTVDSEKEMRHLLMLGVQGLITNDPKLLKGIIHQMMYPYSQ